MDCVRYNKDSVKSRFIKSKLYSIHLTAILGGLKNTVRYTEDFVIYRFVKSRFHCSYVYCIQMESAVVKHKKDGGQSGGVFASYIRLSGLVVLYMVYSLLVLIC